MRERDLVIQKAQELAFNRDKSNLVLQREKDKKEYDRMYKIYAQALSERDFNSLEELNAYIKDNKLDNPIKS